MGEFERTNFAKIGWALIDWIVLCRVIYYIVRPDFEIILFRRAVRCTCRLSRKHVTTHHNIFFLSHPRIDYTQWMAPNQSHSLTFEPRPHEWNQLALHWVKLLLLSSNVKNITHMKLIGSNRTQLWQNKCTQCALRHSSLPMKWRPTIQLTVANNNNTNDKIDCMCRISHSNKFQLIATWMNFNESADKAWRERDDNSCKWVRVNSNDLLENNIRTQRIIDPMA